MRLNTDSEIKAMSTDELQSQISLMNEDKTQSHSTEELRQRLKQRQRTRFLGIWHDHATLLGMGAVMITVHVLYDPAVFYTQPEWDAKSEASLDLQATIECPLIHMFAGGSSAIEDQASLL